MEQVTTLTDATPKVCRRYWAGKGARSPGFVHLRRIYSTIWAPSYFALPRAALRVGESHVWTWNGLGYCSYLLSKPHLIYLTTYVTLEVSAISLHFVVDLGGYGPPSL